MSIILSDFDDEQYLGDFVSPGHVVQSLQAAIEQLRVDSGLDEVDFTYFFQDAFGQFRAGKQGKYDTSDVWEFIREVTPDLVERVDAADVVGIIRRSWNSDYLGNGGLTGQHKRDLVEQILFNVERENLAEASIPPLEPFDEVEVFDAGAGSFSDDPLRICHVRGDAVYPPRITLEPAGVELDLAQLVPFLKAMLAAAERLKELSLDWQVEAIELGETGQRLIAAMKESGTETIGDLMRIRQQSEGDVL